MCVCEQKVTKADEEGKPDYKSIIVDTLKQTKRWMGLTEISVEAETLGLLDSSKIEKVEGVLASTLYTDLCKKKDRTFAFKPDKDLFGLSSWEVEEKRKRLSELGCHYDKTQKVGDLAANKQTSGKRKAVENILEENKDVMLPPKKTKCSDPESAPEPKGSADPKSSFSAAGGGGGAAAAAAAAAPAPEAPKLAVKNQKATKAKQQDQEFLEVDTEKSTTTTTTVSIDGSPDNRQEKQSVSKVSKSRVQESVITDIAKIQQLSLKIGENNLIVGKMWLELSMKLNSEDNFLSEYTLNKAAKILEEYKKEKIAMQKNLMAKKDEIDKKRHLIGELIKQICGKNSHCLGDHQNQPLINCTNALSSVQESQALLVQQAAQAIQVATATQAIIQANTINNNNPVMNTQQLMSLQSALAQAGLLNINVCNPPQNTMAAMMPQVQNPMVPQNQLQQNQLQNQLLMQQHRNAMQQNGMAQQNAAMQQQKQFRMKNANSIPAANNVPPQILARQGKTFQLNNNALSNLLRALKANAMNQGYS